MAKQTSSDDYSDRRKANLTLLILAVVLAAFMIVGLILICRPWWHLASTPLARSIFYNENLTIPARSYLQRDFTVEATSIRQLDGFFNVTDSETDTIRIYVMDGTNFADWQNGQNVSKIYDSEELNSGEFSVSLPTNGAYYIVFDNMPSSTLKTVTADVVLYFL